MNLQETIIQLNELKLRGMSSSFEAMTSLPVQNRPSLEVAISKMVDAEVQDRRDRKTAMYLKISKLRYTALLEDVICGTEQG
jgi:phage-related protein